MSNRFYTWGCAYQTELNDLFRIFCYHAGNIKGISKSALNNQTTFQEFCELVYLQTSDHTINKDYGT